MEFIFYSKHHIDCSNSIKRTNSERVIIYSSSSRIGKREIIIIDTVAITILSNIRINRKSIIIRLCNDILKEDFLFLIERDSSN